MMNKLIVKTATEDDFFKRGRALAKAADAGKAIPHQHTITFEDPAELINLISAARLRLFRTVNQQPGSITEIAHRVSRDRSSVKRDLDALEKAGMISFIECTLPGHGRMKEVRATARQINLQAVVM